MLYGNRLGLAFREGVLQACKSMVRSTMLVVFERGGKGFIVARCSFRSIPRKLWFDTCEYGYSLLEYHFVRLSKRVTSDARRSRYRRRQLWQYLSVRWAAPADTCEYGYSLLEYHFVRLSKRVTSDARRSRYRRRQLWQYLSVRWAAPALMHVVAFTTGWQLLLVPFARSAAK